MLRFARDRTGGGRDRGGRLDALTVASGITLLAWAFVLGPHVRGMDPAAADDWLAVAFPLGDLLCLAALTRLLTTASRRLVAGGLLGAGVVAMIIADVGYDLVRLSGDLRFLASFGRIPLYAAAGLAALHPSMRELTRPAPAPPPDARPGASGPARHRLAGRAGGAARPGVAATGQVPDLPVIAVLSALTFLLVLGRMAGIMASHRLAIARERGLREASAALVSAADAEEAGDAVRTAVAQLLPADVPHRVVLAMAITQPDHPPSGSAAAAQAAVGPGQRHRRPAGAHPRRRLGRRGPADPVHHGAALPAGAAATGRPATRWSACCTSAARPGRCSACSGRSRCWPPRWRWRWSGSR